MPSLTITITVTVNTDTTNFTASSQEETNTDSSFAAAVTGLLPKMTALHASLQGLPDGDLSDEGKNFRDTPLTF